MRGMKPDWVPELVARDVARVERHAAYVLQINGAGVEVVKNQDPKIQVVAVIGPGSAFGQNFDRAVLLEVGIGRARPWQETSSAPKRRPWFQMTPEQYLVVAPTLFRILQEEVNRKVSAWKRGPGNPIYLPVRKTHFYRNIHPRSSQVHVQRGCRFSVARRDWLLLADLYWGLLHVSEHRKIRGSGRYLETVLTMACGKKNLRVAHEDLVLQLAHRLDNGSGRGSWPRYQVWAARKYGRQANLSGLPLLEQFLREQLDWHGEDMPEEVIAEQALPGKEERVRGLCLRDISGTRSSESGKPYLVFEMLPV